MLNFSNADIADFGKIVFVPKNHALPALPDMNLIVLKNSETYQAVCIDIEIDAIGDTMKDACDNLKHALHTYITSMVENNNDNVKAAMEDIVNAAFSEGETKSQLYNRYLQAKHQYIINKIAREHKAKSRKEEFINAWHRIFQLEPIRLNLTLAAGII